MLGLSPLSAAPLSSLYGQALLIELSRGDADARGYRAVVEMVEQILCSIGIATAQGYRAGIGPFSQYQLEFILNYIEENLMIWDEPIEGGKTAAGLLRIIAAAVAGVSNKSGSEITFKGVDGTTDRIVGTFDTNGNRTSSTLDGD